MKILLGILLGSLFGFALHYAGAANPKKLVSMLRLQDLSLMKIIVFAIGFASLLLSLAGLAGIFDLSHLSVKSGNLGVLIGGLIFGFGFAWAGTCPGTCMAAVGSDGVKKALSAVLGGLIGAFLYSLSYGWLKSMGLFDALNFGKLTLFQISEKYPSVFPAGFTGLLVSGIAFMAVGILLPQSVMQDKQ